MTAMEHGITPRVHLEDATKADIYGFVIPFIQRVLRETEGRAKFRVCDTLGLGFPDPYVALPVGVPKLVATIVAETGAEIEWHGHNDFGFATANSVVAWRYGARRVNVAFGGLGERTGNTTLEQVLADYVRIYGDPGFKLEALRQIAELIKSEVSDVNIKSPIVGDAIFTTQSGIHQSGVERQRDAEGGDIYLPFDPRLLGEREEELLRVGSLSGAEGILAALNKKQEEETGQPGRFTATSRVLKHVYDTVQAAYDGEWDEARRAFVNERKSFFSADELYQIAQGLSGPRGPPSQGGRAGPRRQGIPVKSSASRATTEPSWRKNPNACPSSIFSTSPVKSPSSPAGPRESASASHAASPRPGPPSPSSTSRTTWGRTRRCDSRTPAVKRPSSTATSRPRPTWPRRWPRPSRPSAASTSW